MEFIKRKMSSDMNKENMDPGGQNAFEPQQQKMQEDYGQSSAIDFDSAHQHPQRAVVDDPMQQEAPIHHEPPSKGDLMTQQTSGVDNETVRKTAMHTNNPFVVRENQQAATVRAGMPPLPAAGVFDLDAAGNASIITGYDNDPRSFNMRNAKQVAANYDKKSSISDMQKRTSTSTSKDAVPPGRKSSASAWTSSSVTGGAAVAAAAAATATGGGIMAKCVDYLRGSSQQSSQDMEEEDIASPLKDESGGIGQYGPLESKDHPEFTEDVNDVWKNTGPGAAIAKGGGNLGGETAPDVGEYGPLNAEDHPEFVEDVGDPWKSTGPGAAIARGPEDNLVGDPSDPVNKLQGHPFTEKVNDPWKESSGTASATDFPKSRMAAGGIAAGTLGTGVGAAGTSAFDNQSESSTRAMKSDDGDDMIHVYDEDAQPLMKESREENVAEPYKEPMTGQVDDTQAFGVGTHDQQKGIQSDHDTFGQPRDTSWEDPNAGVDKGKKYAAAAGGGAAGAGIGAMAADAARKCHQQDEDDWSKQYSGQQKRRSTDQGVTSSYDKAYSKGGPGIGAVPMPGGNMDAQKQQPSYFAPSTGTQPDTKPVSHDRRLSSDEQTKVACTAGGLGSNVDQSANGSTAAKQPPGSHLDSDKNKTSRAAMGAGAGAATGAGIGAGIGASNIGQKDIANACTKAGLGSNVDQTATTNAPLPGSTMKQTADTTAGAKKYQRKSSTEQEEIAQACQAAGLGANVDQAAGEPMKQPPGSTLPGQKEQPSQTSTAGKSAGIGAGAGAGVGAAIGAATASGGANMTKKASDQAVEDYQKEQSKPKAGFTQDLDESTSAADPYSATRQYHSTREPLHINRKDDDVATGGTGDDIDDPYAKQTTGTTAMGGNKPSQAVETGRIPERERDQSAYTLGDPARERQQSGNTGTAVAEGAALGGATGAAIGAGTSGMGKKQGDQPSNVPMQDNHHPMAKDISSQQQGQKDFGKETKGITDSQPVSATADDLYKQKKQQSGTTGTQDVGNQQYDTTGTQGFDKQKKQQYGTTTGQDFGNQQYDTTGTQGFDNQKQQQYGTTTGQDFGNQQQQQSKDNAPQPPRKYSDQIAEARQEQHARSVPQILDGAVGGIDPQRVGNMSSTKDAYATTGGGGAATAGGMGAAMGAGAGMGSAGVGATNAAEGPRRTSVQDYVTGMFDARRGSIKEKFGKLFHKQDMQQQGKDLQNTGTQKVQSFISKRRQSQGRAGL